MGNTRAWFGNAIDKACAWYRETHTSASTGMLSNRNQAYSFVVVAVTLVLVYDGLKRGIRREWNETVGLLLLGVTTTKVWPRGKKDEKSVAGDTT